MLSTPIPDQKHHDLQLLAYRLRRLHERGVLDILELDRRLDTLILSTGVDQEFPDDPLLRLALSKNCSEQSLETCLWHVLWQISQDLTAGATLANKVCHKFPNPLKEGVPATIYATGRVLSKEDSLLFNTETAINRAASAETAKRFWEAKANSNWPKFSKFIAWRDPRRFSLFFTPLPGVW